MRVGSALATASVCLGAAGSTVLAYSHGTWMRAAWAGMDYAFAVEATGTLQESREVRREAWRAMTEAAALSPLLLLRASLALYLACAALAIVAAYRQRAVWGAWLWLDLLALIPAFVGVYLVARLFFGPSLSWLGLASGLVACAVSGVGLWRRRGQAAARAMARTTLALGALTATVSLAVRMLWGGVL